MNTRKCWLLVALAAVLGTTTTQAATVAELVARHGRGGAAEAGSNAWAPPPRPAPRLAPRDRRAYTPAPPFYDPPPSWILGHRVGSPARRIVGWTYGQARAGDDPYSWRTLDNYYLRIPWGNPLAPWTGAEMAGWWQRRSGIPSYFAPVW